MYPDLAIEILRYTADAQARGQFRGVVEIGGYDQTEITEGVRRMEAGDLIEAAFIDQPLQPSGATTYRIIDITPRGRALLERPG